MNDTMLTERPEDGRLTIKTFEPTEESRESLIGRLGYWRDEAERLRRQVKTLTDQVRSLKESLRHDGKRLNLLEARDAGWRRGACEMRMGHGAGLWRMLETPPVVFENSPEEAE